MATTTVGLLGGQRAFDTFDASLARRASARSLDLARLDIEETLGEWAVVGAAITSRGVNVHYGDNHAVKSVNLDIGRKQVIALIGPSGCGKSSYLRCLNRMNDAISGFRFSGRIELEQQDIHARGLNPIFLRAQVGMVFQTPNPFPKSVYDNVAYGPRIHGMAEDKAELDQIVERSLTRVGLFAEVRDRLFASATGLSGGQQQRLCIARAIALKPDVILMDEPCSALDPIASAKIEDLIDELRVEYTIVIVTHNMQQAARVSQRTAYFHLGHLVEVGVTRELFENPKHELTLDYITGRFG